MIKATTKRILERLCSIRGYTLLKASDLPHGCDWKLDLKWASSAHPLRAALDIGANVGQTAHALTVTFPGIQVQCFEPVASTFASLRVAASEMSGVTCHRLAMADTSGYLMMSAAPSAGTNRLLTADATSASSEMVPVSTVDAFCDQTGLSAVDLLKLDVEGAEMRVLAGAVQTLRNRSVRFVLSECDFFDRHDQPHAKFSDLQHFLSNFGFRVFSFYTAAVDRDGWRWGNVLFSRPFSMTTEFSRSPFARNHELS